MSPLDPPPSPLSSLREPPTVLRPERLEPDGWDVRLPWCMPRALATGFVVLSVIVGMSPVIALQTLDGSWADSLCVLGPVGLSGVAISFACYHGIRFALGRVLCTRFELLPDGVRIDGQWHPADELPEASGSHRVYRSEPNEGGSAYSRRVDRLHLGDRSFACDVGRESTDWLATAVNLLRTTESPATSVQPDP